MEQIRYKQRICTDQERIERFITDKRVGVLGMCDLKGAPYSLPVNYVYLNGNIYLHGLGSGKKNDVLQENPSVCFNIFEEFGTVADKIPCKCDTAYFSVILFGEAQLVGDKEEKSQALTAFMSKFMPGAFKSPLSGQYVEKYTSSHDNRPVAVFRIVPSHISAKENTADPGDLISKSVF